MKKIYKRETIFHLCYLLLVACTKDQHKRFIFNNRISIVNSLLHQVLCGDGVYICKIKKIKVACHVVTDKLIVTKKTVAIRDREAGD